MAYILLYLYSYFLITIKRLMSYGLKNSLFLKHAQQYKAYGFEIEVQFHLKRPLKDLEPIQHTTCPQCLDLILSTKCVS